MARITPFLLSAVLGIARAGCNSGGEPGPVGAQGPREGRISAMAAVVWACPLENWDLGSDDGCDPIETGTAIKIHRRGVRPKYRHGPFALIEYDHEGTTKTQYVIDMNVTPLDEDDPTIDDLLRRERAD